MATSILRPPSGNIIPFPVHARDVAARRIVANSLRAAIAELVDLLDAVEGDVDLEPEQDRCQQADDGAHSGTAFAYLGLDHMEEGPGDAADAENQQMADDVPTVPCVTLDVDPTTGERSYAGHTNLMSSFMSGSRRGLFSADSGRRYAGNIGGTQGPGRPV